jgi:hypothetical protein
MSTFFAQGTQFFIKKNADDDFKPNQILVFINEESD